MVVLSLACLFKASPSGYALRDFSCYIFWENGTSIFLNVLPLYFWEHKIALHCCLRFNGVIGEGISCKHSGCYANLILFALMPRTANGAKHPQQGFWWVFSALNFSSSWLWIQWDDILWFACGFVGVIVLAHPIDDLWRMALWFLSLGWHYSLLYFS